MKKIEIEGYPDEVYRAGSILKTSIDVISEIVRLQSSQQLRLRAPSTWSQAGQSFRDGTHLNKLRVVTVESVGDKIIEQREEFQAEEGDRRTVVSHRFLAWDRTTGQIVSSGESELVSEGIVLTPKGRISDIETSVAEVFVRLVGSRGGSTTSTS